MTIVASAAEWNVMYRSTKMMTKTSGIDLPTVAIIPMPAVVEWRKATGKPFVYALWLIRPDVPDAKSIAQRLRGLRDENLADIPVIVSDAVADVADNKHEITQEFLDRYYNEHLRFGFGTREKQGLQTFADLCSKHEVLPKRVREFSLV